MAERTLYLFDGYNLLHAGVFEDARQLRDALASFVALKGATGIVVFDGVGDLEGKGPLEVRYAAHADALLERLAAEHRSTAEVILVSSDAAVRGTSGIRVQNISSQTFLADLEPALGPGNPPSDLRDRLDPETLARLERLRRGGR
jgi:predicted RNA-binding protein with PIN domain